MQAVHDVRYVLYLYLVRESKNEGSQGEEAECKVIGVPYSEHSSFFELTCFALSVPGLELKMIATVNVGNEKRYVATPRTVSAKSRTIRL